MIPTKCASCGVTLTIEESAGRKCPACGAALAETTGDVSTREPAPRPMREPAPRRGGGVFTFILAFLALLVAVAAFLQSWLNDPFGIALIGYDFSTPEAALRSDAKLNANGDIRAALAYRAKIEASPERDRFQTLKIEETLDAKGGKLVFYTWKIKERVRYDVDGFTFDEKSKCWHPDPTLPFSPDLDEDVRKKIAEWRAKEHGGP